VDLRVTGAQIGNLGGDEVGDWVQGVEDLDGTAFNDQITGNDDSNYLAGGEGADAIYGLNGFDRIRGGSGSDTTYGGEGAADIRGDNDSDELYSGAGGATIEGGSLNDQIFGGMGSDYIIAGTGNDTIWGEQETDAIHFADRLYETDVVKDFEDGIDRLWFAPTAANDIRDILPTGNGTSSVILTIRSNTLTLNGAGPINMAADDLLVA
jgi:Ca2+-binding RTX toxin-like protein